MVFQYPPSYNQLAHLLGLPRTEHQTRQTMPDYAEHSNLPLENEKSRQIDLICNWFFNKCRIAQDHPILWLFLLIICLSRPSDENLSILELQYPSATNMSPVFSDTATSVGLQKCFSSAPDSKATPKTKSGVFVSPAGNYSKEYFCCRMPLFTRNL